MIVGCVGTGPHVAPPPTGSSLGRPVVVALLDTGINVYHGVFANRSGEIGVPSDVSAIPFNTTSSGTYEERVNADKSQWAGIQRGALYAFSGTRVLGISFLSGGEMIRDTIGHGTGTASQVADSAPDAIIVMIQISPDPCFDGSCVVSPSVAEGLTWAANQSWIDVISISLGSPGNSPDEGRVHPAKDAFLAASRRAVESGKLVVAGAGNEAAPTIASYMCGPPWIVAVGGIEPANRGDSPYSAKGADVVANFSAYVASVGSTTDRAWTSGTSFSTPIVAGTLARVLANLGGPEWQRPLTVDKSLRIRNALNESAHELAATEYDPIPGPENGTLLGRVLSPSTPVLFPPAETGWGYVTSDTAKTITALLVNGTSLAPHAETTRTYMSEWRDLRARAWP
jgi:hypothetical protein